MTEVVAVQRHRAAPPDPPPPDPAVMPDGLAVALRRNVLLMAFANLVAAAGMTFADPGTSPSLGFLALALPLPVWASILTAAALIQVFRPTAPLIGHALAVPVWLMLAIGATAGLLSRSSSSPAASVVLVGLIALATGLHVNGMEFRRREARARRENT